MAIALDKIDQYVMILEAKNPNIDWLSFINEHMGRDERHILKRIKSLLWVDKQLDYTQKYNNEYWFRYYTHLLGRYQNKLRPSNMRSITAQEQLANELRLDKHLWTSSMVPKNDSNKKQCRQVCVLGIPDDTSHCLDILVTIITDKLNVLHRMLCMLGIEYKLVKAIPSDDCILIPTASILYPSCELPLCNIVPDGFDNIVYEDNDVSLNRFKIKIDLISSFQELSIDDILQCEYGTLHLIP